MSARIEIGRLTSSDLGKMLILPDLRPGRLKSIRHRGEGRTTVELYHDGWGRAPYTLESGDLVEFTTHTPTEPTTQEDGL